MPGMELRAIDRKTGIKGIGAALMLIGWLAECQNGLRLVRFDEHNDTSAKRRCEDAKRKASGRKVSAAVRTEDGQDADRMRTGCGQDADRMRTVYGNRRTVYGHLRS